MARSKSALPPATRRVLLAISSALGVAGVLLAAWLLYAKIRIRYDATFASGCNFGGSLNCDAVQTSPYSQILGVPVALLAIPTYVLMAWLALRGKVCVAERVKWAVW